MRVYERQRKKRDGDEKKRNIFLASVIFLIPGLAMFLFIPAGIFVALEVAIVKFFFIIFCFSIHLVNIDIDLHN